MSLPVFDSSTPKVSIIAVGMGVLESANELVTEAGQQAAKFQPQASDKAEFMLQACGRVPGGSWLRSARNANVDGNTLTAELGINDGPTQYAEAKVTFKDGETFTNTFGKFVPEGTDGQPTFTSSVKKCTLANATGVRLVFIEEGSSPFPVSEYKPPPILEPGAIASFLVDKDPKKSFSLNYNIQVFQGPFRGWMAVDTDPVTVAESTSGVKIKSDVQVADTKDYTKAPTKYPTTIFFDAYPVSDDLVQIHVKQVIDQTPA